MKRKLNVLALACGIGTGREVFKRLGIDVEYHSIEISDWKRKIADTNHSDIIRPFNDILEMACEEVMPFYDIVLCGFTCTSLSSMGKKEIWEGESKIFWDCLEILEKCKQTNPKLYFVFENVASMKNVIRDEISQNLGATAFLGDSSLTSAQQRKRYYWFNYAQPIIEDKKIMANDILDEDGLHLFSFSKSNRNKVGQPAIVEGRMKDNGKAGTLVTGKGCRGQSTFNQVITKKLKIRDLTITECKRLMGIENYILDCSDTQAFEALGEGWEANMIEQVLRACPIVKQYLGEN